MSLQTQADFRVTVNHPKSGLLQYLSTDIICNFPGYPFVFHVNRADEYDLTDPKFGHQLTPLSRALVEKLVKPRPVGILDVVFSSLQGMKIIYDPKVVSTSYVEQIVQIVVKHVKEHGW
jgi:hypothetical protein